MSVLTRRLLAGVAIALSLAFLTFHDQARGDELDCNRVIKQRIAAWQGGPSGAILMRDVCAEAPTGPKAGPPGRRAVALCVGVNNTSYPTGPLSGCVNDATDVAGLLTAQQFQVTMLTDSPPSGQAKDQARSTSVSDYLRAQASVLKSGDILAFYFAGHGGSVKADPGSAYPYREAIALYDRMMFDDELHELFKLFEPGVRLVGINDSCENGTILRMLEIANKVMLSPRFRLAGTVTPQHKQMVEDALFSLKRDVRAGLVDPKVVAVRSIAPEQAAALFQRREYDAYRARKLRSADDPTNQLRTTLLHFAACTDIESAGEINGHGYFTSALLDVWKQRPVSYQMFSDGISAMVRQETGNKQNPQLSVRGVPNADFKDHEAPFSK